METAFAKVGINSAEELHALGADRANETLLSSGIRPHFIAYYSLVMGLQNRPWNDCVGNEKIALRAQFDTIVSQKRTTPQASLTDALNEVGIRLDQHQEPSKLRRRN